MRSYDLAPFEVSELLEETFKLFPTIFCRPGFPLQHHPLGFRTGGVRPMIDIKLLAIYSILMYRPPPP